MGVNFYYQTSLFLPMNEGELLHLGKLSVGWKFLLQYNKGKYYKNWQEMKNFLKKTNKKIIDSKNEEIFIDKFIELVESFQDKKSHSNVIDGIIKDKDGYEFLNGAFS